jgi:hypothetical protein
MKSSRRRQRDQHDRTAATGSSFPLNETSRAASVKTIV